MDGRDFRNCMGKFATGVTVVTCETENGTHGITANAFTSVSMNPPLVLVSIDEKTKACEMMKNNNFIINVLKADQKDTAMHFAGKPKEVLPFEWEESVLGSRIKDSLAHIECLPWAEYDGGDHILFVGKVESYEHHDGEPLTFYCGQFSQIASAIS